MGELCKLAARSVQVKNMPVANTSLDILSPGNLFSFLSITLHAVLKDNHLEAGSSPVLVLNRDVSICFE